MLNAQLQNAEFRIKENQIEIKTVTRLLSIGSPIVDEVKTRNFDTVVMGRSGINKSFFTGSVTNYVLNNVSNAAFLPKNQAITEILQHPK